MAQEKYFPKSRLEAFSDGVIAIIITVMVIELKAPQGHDLAALKPLIPIFLTYLLSFVYLAIYWNNHHHLIHAAKWINSKIMWANMYLLFWLSLIPFVTWWLGENLNESWPVALYSTVLLMAALAYFILQGLILSTHGKESELARSVGSDIKGKISLLSYACAILLAFINQWLADALIVMVALMWFIPDKRMEKSA